MSNKGRQGELLFKQLMEQQGYIVKDVTMQPEYQYKDIDFVITSTSGLTKTFEVKWDYKINKTNNLFLEVASANSYQWGCSGWWEMCKADYLVYGDAINRKFYIFNLLELRQIVSQLPKNYAECGKDSLGLLVNLNQIKKYIQGVM